LAGCPVSRMSDVCALSTVDIRSSRSGHVILRGATVTSDIAEWLPLALEWGSNLSSIRSDAAPGTGCAVLVGPGFFLPNRQSRFARLRAQRGVYAVRESSLSPAEHSDVDGMQRRNQSYCSRRRCGWKVLGRPGDLVWRHRRMARQSRWARFSSGRVAASFSPLSTRCCWRPPAPVDAVIHPSDFPPPQRDVGGMGYRLRCRHVGVDSLLTCPLCGW